MACEKWDFIKEQYTMEVIKRTLTSQTGYSFKSKGWIGLYCRHCFHPVKFKDYIHFKIPNIKQDGYRPDAVSITPVYKFKCPKCGHTSVFHYEIDVNITPMIAELNRKGFVTKYCCEGHSIDYDKALGCRHTLERSYIFFDIKKLPDANALLEVYPLPKPWQRDISKIYWTDKWGYDTDKVRKDWSNEFIIEVPIEDDTPINDRMVLLRDWVDSLPDLT